ncbi:MAG TPA: hypothetical protein VFW11_14230 [Cyclobacteriaceae bacterium]|nr:hypothetical protein [Cyclobacteriaceae bacterium]
MKRTKQILLFLLTIAGAVSVYAQDDKIEPRIDLSYFQSDNDVPYVVVQVRKKIERRFLPLAGIPVTLYFQEESDSMKIGEIISNAKGEVKMLLPDRLMEYWNQLDSYDFLASVASNDSIEAGSESLTINRARIHISTDSTEKGRLIQAVIERKQNDKWVPVPDVEMKIFVNRRFGRLFIGEETYTSDEDGLIEAEFSGDMPGDENGVIEFGCMIEDHEEFGTLFAYAKNKWGTPMVDDNSAFAKRTLWSSRNKTPYWLLIFPNLAIAGVWGIIGYLILQIYRIKKLAKGQQ